MVFVQKPKALSWWNHGTDRSVRADNHPSSTQTYREPLWTSTCCFWKQLRDFLIKAAESNSALCNLPLMSLSSRVVQRQKKRKKRNPAKLDTTIALHHLFAANTFSAALLLSLRLRQVHGRSTKHEAAPRKQNSAEGKCHKHSPRNITNVKLLLGATLAHAGNI